MRNTRPILTLALLLMSAVSCQTMPRENASAHIEHIVVCWLKQPGDQDARRRIISESRAFLGVIPGLVRVSAGPALPSPRPAVDSSFDVAIVMTFRDEASLRAYDEHPQHKHAVENVLRPLVQKIVIYDMQDEE